MILKWFILLMIAVHALGQTPSTNTYLLGISQLIPQFDATNFFDGPSYVSNASTTPTTNKKPTIDQMKYYNYYTGSVNCAYGVLDMSCYYCQYIKKDIYLYKVLQNDTHDTSALLALSKTRNEIVIAYRATENFWNVVLDALLIQYAPIPGSSIKIHKGIYTATMSLYVDVVKGVICLRSLCPTCKIVITGHSLGAGMARISELLFITLNQFPGACYEVYTFGEPRTGNQFYVDYLNSLNITTARITARADLVPHIPPVSILGLTFLSDFYEYIHVQIEYWINGTDGQKFADQSTYEDTKCSNSLGPAYSGLDHFTYFDVDHLRCLGDGQEIFAFPIIFQPVDDFPQWPTFIADGLSEGAHGFVEVFSPVLGR